MPAARSDQVAVFRIVTPPAKENPPELLLHRGKTFPQSGGMFPVAGVGKKEAVKPLMGQKKAPQVIHGFPAYGYYGTCMKAIPSAAIP